MSVAEDNIVPPKKIGWLKLLLIVLLGLLLLIILSFSIYLYSGSKKSIAAFNSTYLPEESNAIESQLLENDSFYALKSDEAFLKTRLKMAESDSFSLSINIPDSLISIEIKGVTVYTIKIDQVYLSNIFTHYNRGALLNYISSPFTISNQESNLIKEPVIIKIAPKDTSEVAASAPNIDTLGPKLVYYRYTLNNNLLLDIRQSEIKDGKSKLGLALNYYRWKSKIEWDNLTKTKSSAYIPWIRIEINKTDAIALYRALPQNAFIGIRF